MPKTAFVTTSNLDVEKYVKSTEKFIKYYKEKFQLYQFDWDFIVLENGSSLETCKEFAEKHQVKIINLQPKLGRPSMLDAPYAWRNLYALKPLLNEYEKIVFMETDFYALSPRFFNYLNTTNSGWVTFWCPKFSFPETACFVLNKHCAAFENYVAKGDFLEHNGELMETSLPVTNIEFRFMGDRFGEYETRLPVVPEFDFWAQSRLEDQF